MNIPIFKEGFPYIIFLLILTLVFFFVNKILFTISLILTLFVIFFFRNPNRKILINENNILSPADGKIMKVEKIYEDTLLKSNATKISIFLSIFNVHANKAPIDGKIIHSEYKDGKFLPAFKNHSSELNEKNTIGIENNNMKILVNQITGFIARRIVCWVKEGDTVNQGQNFGLIKFGSCTEIIIPNNAKVLVKPGQIVKGGISVIGGINNEN